MPALVHRLSHLSVHVIRKAPRADIDEDARSDCTLDDDNHFGVPLERFGTYDDDDDTDAYVLDDEHVSALRISQDESWLASRYSDDDQYSSGSGTPSSDDEDLLGTPEGKHHVPESEVTFKELKADSAELDLLEYLNTEEIRDDPWNHSVPILDIIPHEKHVEVMMLRLQPFDSPPFQNVAEFLDLLRQLLEGLAFFHEHRITQLDFSPSNIGMDTGLLPVDAPNWDRSEHHVQYHLMDLSGAFHASKTQDLSDSERLDVKALGSSLQGIFRKMPEMDFLSQFLASMTGPDAASRPSATEALARLDTMSANLPPEKIFERISLA
ncbi:hypothetical protein FRB94_009239 [Tulasnella sp. JGI-2019a]|nr:hypothetical protein FRB94_009239 [Tulasnella sp. JGI-2019a]KAG9030561.1 hypothetical protein FRB95_003822 [Tulasnella sp. JGI-2019a]